MDEALLEEMRDLTAPARNLEAIYMCATTLNSDPERFREPMVQAANLDVDTDPGPEPAPVIPEPGERD